MLSPHHFPPNERVNSPPPSSADEENSEHSSDESENSSETPPPPPPNLISYNSYAYATQGKRRKKLRPPKLMRKIIQRPIPSNERIKTKQAALQFNVTEVTTVTAPPAPPSPSPHYLPHHHHHHIPSTDSVTSPSHSSTNSHRLALVAYNPRYIRQDESWGNDELDEQYSNLSEEDDFSDYHNEEANDAEYHNDEENDSLDEDFAGKFSRGFEPKTKF